jgi:hypothetical protein
MQGDDGSTRRLDSLLDDLFADRPSEASDILGKVSQLVTPRNRSLAQVRIARRLRAMTAFSPEMAVKAACALHVSGVPAHRLVHFLSTSLPGSLTLTQFELAVRFIFDDDPPLPQQLLYDLTRYTYLEKKLLTRRSVELASRLRGTLTPRLLLYLYLLSLRDDLSNENVHLILLILRICFPALKVRGRSGRISPLEEREAAEAWRNAQKSARYAQLSPPVPRAVAPEERQARESASYFLDKYFSVQEAEKQPAQKISFTSSSSRGGVPRAAKPDPRPRPRIQAGARGSRKTTATLPPRGPATPRTAVPKQPPLSAPSEGPYLALAPFILAAVLVAVLVCANLTMVESLTISRGGAGGQPAAATPAAPAVPAASAGEQAPSPPTLTPHVVQQGDSLWKIYRSLRREGTVDTRWKDFVRIMKKQNGLRDPDRIYPGNVLSVTTELR